MTQSGGRQNNTSARNPNTEPIRRYDLAGLAIGSLQPDSTDCHASYLNAICSLVSFLLLDHTEESVLIRRLINQLQDFHLVSCQSLVPSILSCSDTSSR